MNTLSLARRELVQDYLLVFPAASSPSMRRRISLEPKILPIIFETWPPMAAVLLALYSLGQ